MSCFTSSGKCGQIAQGFLKIPEADIKYLLVNRQRSLRSFVVSSIRTKEQLHSDVSRLDGFGQGWVISQVNIPLIELQPGHIFMSSWIVANSCETGCIVLLQKLIDLVLLVRADPEILFPIVQSIQIDVIDLAARCCHQQTGMQFSSFRINEVVPSRIHDRIPATIFDKRKILFVKHEG